MEAELVNFIKHLQVTYNTLNHFTKDTEGMSVYRVNLEYTKKVIYEQLEMKVRELNNFRYRNSDRTPLHSTILGEIKAECRLYV